MLRTKIMFVFRDEGEIDLGKGGGVSFKKLTLQDDDGLETDLTRTNGMSFIVKQQIRC